MRRIRRSLQYLQTGQRSRVFGRFLNKHLDETGESIIDRYVDEDAKEIVAFALNIINKHLVCRIVD